MRRRQIEFRLLTVAIAFMASVSVASADLIKLKAGGEVRGKIDRGVSITKADPLVITTMSGTVVAVARKDIAFVTRRSLTVEEYETRKRRVANTIKAQWNLAGWCRSKGMKKERETHLHNVIHLDAEHRDARRALGYTKKNGNWSTSDERQRARGLVRHKGRWITPEERAVIEKTAAATELEREWAKKVKMYHAWLSHRVAEKRADGVKKLGEITNPNAVVGLERYLTRDKKSQVRAFYVEILEKIAGPKATSALAGRVLHDPSDQIRYQAINAIPKNQYATAMGLFARSLRNPSNLIVRRAAVGLSRVGDERAIPSLIAALVTTHKYRIRVKDRSNTIGVGANGTAARSNVLPPNIEAMLRAGLLPNGVIVNDLTQINKPVRTKVITITRNLQNSEVLSALKTISGQSYGYNKRNWQLWLASTKTGNGPVVKSP